MPFKGATERIREAMLSLPNVSAAPHRFGGIEFKLGKRELGHTHIAWHITGQTVGRGIGHSIEQGNEHEKILLDIPFPMSVRNKLVGSGKVQPHHILPRSGWVSYIVDSEAEVEFAIELLRMSYTIAATSKKSISESRL